MYQKGACWEINQGNNVIHMVSNIPNNALTKVGKDFYNENSNTLKKWGLKRWK